MTTRTPFEIVRDLIDELGTHMTPDDWIDFLAEIEDDVRSKRQTAEQEQEDDDD
jgi:hypothetical protein